MNSKYKSHKELSPRYEALVERLNQALPNLIEPENRNLLPTETAQIYYARLEPYRRSCEARTVLHWIAGAYFDSEIHTVTCRLTDHSVACYFAEVSTKRSKEAATILKNDVLDLLCAVSARDPSLHDLLSPKLKLL